MGSRNTVWLKINPSTLGESFPASLWSSFQQSKQLLVAGEISPRDAEIAVSELGSCGGNSSEHGAGAPSVPGKKRRERKYGKVEGWEVAAASFLCSFSASSQNLRIS